MSLNSPNESMSPKAEGRRLGGGAIASLTGVGLLTIFMIQNTDSVQLDFLVWSYTWPLWLLTMTSAASRGVGVVRSGRNAPSPSPQGTPPKPSGLNRPKPQPSAAAIATAQLTMPWCPQP